MTPLVAGVRDRLEALMGVRYDSVLINFYPDGKSGMRFHADPLHEPDGRQVWADETSVVSLGATREFVLRTALRHSPAAPQQQQAAPPRRGKAAAAAAAAAAARQQGPPPPTLHWSYVVESGDAVRMFGDCQARGGRRRAGAVHAAALLVCNAACVPNRCPSPPHTTHPAGALSARFEGGEGGGACHPPRVAGL